MTPTTRPPVPHWARLEFEDAVRRAVTTHDPDDTNSICGAARDVTRQYAWATTRDTANALINTLGVGYGAIYLDWAWNHTGRGRAA